MSISSVDGVRPYQGKSQSKAKSESNSGFTFFFRLICLDTVSHHPSKK
jgi:hypothetical protein